MKFEVLLFFSSFFEIVSYIIERVYWSSRLKGFYCHDILFWSITVKQLFWNSVYGTHFYTWERYILVYVCICTYICAHTHVWSMRAHRFRNDRITVSIAPVIRNFENNECSRDHHWHAELFIWAKMSSGSSDRIAVPLVDEQRSS